MKHYQLQFQCGICKREFVVDIISIGTTHQTIQAITCLKCAKKVGGKIMKNEIEELKFENDFEIKPY